MASNSLLYMRHILICNRFTIFTLPYAVLCFFRVVLLRSRVSLIGASQDDLRREIQA